MIVYCSWDSFFLHYVNKKMRLKLLKKTATLEKNLLLSITKVLKQSKTIYDKNLVESRGCSDL